MTLPPLTAEQREAVHETGGMPVSVIDRATSNKYVLMHESAFEAILAAVREHDPDTAEFLEAGISY